MFSKPMVGTYSKVLFPHRRHLPPLVPAPNLIMLKPGATAALLLLLPAVPGPSDSIEHLPAMDHNGPGSDNSKSYLFAAHAHDLDLHIMPDHNRLVFTSGQNQHCRFLSTIREPGRICGIARESQVLVQNRRYPELLAPGYPLSYRGTQFGRVHFQPGRAAAGIRGCQARLRRSRRLKSNHDFNSYIWFLCSLAASIPSQPFRLRLFSARSDIRAGA